MGESSTRGASSVSDNSVPSPPGFSAVSNVNPCANNSHHSNSEPIVDNDPLYGELEEYNKLVKLYHEYPKDLFVSNIVRMYSSSESELEQVRAEYFEVLKQEHDDFPFGLEAELKRRVFRGNGEPIAIKLAQDIYTIISVSQGEDYDLLKEMISKSRRRTVSFPVRNDKEQTSAANRNLVSSANANTKHTCQCASEVVRLKDAVSSLQAGYLLLCQNLHAIDELRTGQMNYVMAMLKAIKCDILESNQSMRRTVIETELAIGKKQGEIIKSDLDLHNRVDKLEKFIDTNALYSITALDTVLPNAAGCVDESVQTFGDAVVPEAADGEARANNEELQTVDFVSTDTSVEHTASEVTDIEPPTYVEAIGVDSPTYKEEFEISDEHAKEVIVIQDDPTTVIDDSVTMETNEQSADPIPVRVTRRTGYKENNDGFERSKSKHTRHFCLLGFRKSVNRDLLHSFISKGGYLANEIRTGQGPTVYTIRLFQMRRNPGKLVVRVNVSADFSAELLLNDRFWPSYVSCEPWRSRLYRQRLNIVATARGENNNSVMHDRTQQNVKTSGFIHRNRFGELECDVD